jgi:hypothetical protein
MSAGSAFSFIPYWPAGTHEFDKCVSSKSLPSIAKGRPDVSDADFKEGKVVR